MVTPPDWDGKVKPGQDPQKAREDLNVNPQAYAIACQAATENTMIGGAKSPYFKDSSSNVDDWVPGDWGWHFPHLRR